MTFADDVQDALRHIEGAETIPTSTFQHLIATAAERTVADNREFRGTSAAPAELKERDA